MADNQLTTENIINQSQVVDFDIPEELLAETNSSIKEQIASIDQKNIMDNLFQNISTLDQDSYATQKPDEQTQQPPTQPSDLQTPTFVTQDEYAWINQDNEFNEHQFFVDSSFSVDELTPPDYLNQIPLDDEAYAHSLANQINNTQDHAQDETHVTTTTANQSPTPPDPRIAAAKLKNSNKSQVVEGEVFQVNNDAKRSKLILLNNGVKETYLLTSDNNEGEIFTTLKDIKKGDTVALDAKINKHKTDENTYWANDSAVNIVIRAPKNEAEVSQNKDEIGKNRVIGLVTKKVANDNYKALSIKDESGNDSIYIFNVNQNKSEAFHNHFNDVEVGDTIDLKSNLNPHKTKENTFWANQSSLTVDKALYHGNPRIDANGNRLETNALLEGSQVPPSIFMVQSKDVINEVFKNRDADTYTISPEGIEKNTQYLKDLNLLSPVVVDGKDANVIKIHDDYVTMLKIGDKQVPFYLDTKDHNGWQAGLGFDENGVIKIDEADLTNKKNNLSDEINTNSALLRYNVILNDALPSSQKEQINAVPVEVDKENMAVLDALVSDNPTYDDNFKASRADELLDNIEQVRLDNLHKVLDEPHIKPVLEVDSITGHLIEDIDVDNEEPHIFIEAEDKSRKLEIHSPLFGDMAKAGLLKKGDLVTLEAKSLKNGSYIDEGISITNHSQKNAFMEIPSKKDELKDDLTNASLVTTPSTTGGNTSTEPENKVEAKAEKPAAKDDIDKKKDTKDKPKNDTKKSYPNKKDNKDGDKPDDDDDEEYKKYKSFGSGYNPKGRHDSKKYTDDDGGSTIINNFYNSPQDNPNNQKQNQPSNGGGGGGGGGGSYQATSDFVVGAAGIAGGILGACLDVTKEGLSKGSQAFKQMNEARRAKKAAQAYGSGTTNASAPNNPSMGISTPTPNSSSTTTPATPPPKKPAGLGFSVPTASGSARSGTPVDILAQRIHDGAARGETMNGAVLGTSLSQTHDYFNSFKDNYETIDKLSSSSDPKDKAEAARRKGLLQDDFDKYSKMSQTTARHGADPKKATQETSGLVHDSLKEMNSKMEDMVDDSLKKNYMNEKDANGILNKEKMQKINEALAKAIAKATEAFAKAMSKIFSKPSAGKAP